MQYTNKYLSCELKFLDVVISDKDDARQLAQHQNETNVIISMTDLKYLSWFTQIERLIITAGEAPDDASLILKSIKNLRELKLDYDETEPFTKWCIDISVFNNLEYLFSRSSYNFRGAEKSKSLKTLIVHNWYSADLLQLKNSCIDTLRINCGKLTNLNGIENVPLLILSLSNLRGLTNIKNVEKLPLKILEIDNCNNILNLQSVSSTTLEYLMV